MHSERKSANWNPSAALTGTSAPGRTSLITRFIDPIIRPERSGRYLFVRSTPLQLAWTDLSGSDAAAGRRIPSSRRVSTSVVCSRCDRVGVFYSSAVVSCVVVPAQCNSRLASQKVGRKFALRRWRRPPRWSEREGRTQTRCVLVDCSESSESTLQPPRCPRTVSYRHGWSCGLGCSASDAAALAALVEQPAVSRRRDAIN